MAGVLSFSLGLATAGFNGPLAGAALAMEGFTIGAKAAQIAVTGLEKAMEKGAKLFDVSMAIGSSVHGLYQLEAGFRAVHISGDEAVPMSLRLERALSGVSETGERTEATFAQLGLDMIALRRLDPVTQFEQIAQALGRVNAAMAPGLAANLFGRGGEGHAMQIARQQSAFQQGISGGAPGAQIFAEMAQAFQKVLVTVDQIGAKLQAGFAIASRYLIDPLQGFLEVFADIDWEGIGQNVSVVVGGFVEAFKEGKLALLIGQSFEVGLKFAAIMAPAVFSRIAVELTSVAAKFGIGLLQAFKLPLNFLQAGMTFIAQHIMAQLSKIPGFAKIMGVEKFEAPTWSDTWRNQKERGLNFGFSLGVDDLVDSTIPALNKGANGAIEAFRGLSNEFLKASWNAAMLESGMGDLATTFKIFASKLPKHPASDKDLFGGSSVAHTYRPSANQWEKMGFIFNGGPANRDYNREISNNTKQTNQILMAMKKDKTSHIDAFGKSFRNAP